VTSRTRIAAILGIALIAPLAAACSDDGGGPRAASPQSATAAAPSTGRSLDTSPAAPAAAAPAQTDGVDGVQVARVVRVDPAAGTVTVDVIQFLTGDAATRAAAEDGAEVPPPNDYYIRNASSRLRTLPVASTAPITINVHGAQESGSATTDIPKTLAELAGIQHLEDGAFRLTLQDGQVIRIAEIYIP
jgi:hypothetical protein